MTSRAIAAATDAAFGELEDDEDESDTSGSDSDSDEASARACALLLHRAYGLVALNHYVRSRT